MIKIEVKHETRENINYNHREYVKLTSIHKLESNLKGKRRGKKREFLEKLFGVTPEKRELCVIDFCLSADLKGKLNQFNKTFEEVYGFEFYDAVTAQNEKVIQFTRCELDSILYYDGFNDGKKLSNGKKWSRHEFIKSFGVKVCPYCNRQYITSYEDGTANVKTTADADHYYPKA